MTAPTATTSAPDHRDRWPLVERRELVDRACSRLTERGVIISGFAGVGKTGLSRLVEDRLAADGWTVTRVTATLSGREVPYSALAGVVDVGTADHELQGTLPTPDHIGAALRGGGSRDRTVLIVDDAQWLDAGSTALLHGFVHRGDVSIVATVRSGEPGADEWEALADDGLLHRISLDPADRSLIAAIVEAALGNPAAPPLVDELAERSAGNLLFLRELVLAGVEHGAVARSGRRWKLVGDLPTGDGLGTTIARRIRSLDESANAALAAIAIVEPLPFEIARQLSLADQLGGLERRGFAVTDTDGTVRMAHPLLGEAARASLTASEFRHCLDDVTDAVLAKLDAYDTDLALRLVAQRCAYGLFVPVDWLRAAAGRAFALLDHELAVTLGRRALDAEPLDVEANLVVGAGLSAQFLTADAEPHLRSALDHARTDSQRARSAGRLGLHLGTRLGRRDAALELMRQQLDRLTEPRWQQFLGADIGKIELLAGQATSSPAGSAGDDPLSVLNQAIMGALVSSLAGDVAATRAHVERGLPLTARHIGPLPNGRDLLRLGEYVALLVEGDVAAAEALASVELEACRTGRDEPIGMWRAMLATSALTSGDPARAEQEALAALPLVAARDFVGGLHPTTQALRAVALAQLGRFTDAESQIADIDAVWADDPRTNATVRQAQAWRTALGRSEPVGASLACAAADVAAAGMTSVALPIAYDAVRLDEADTVVELLESLAAAAPATIAALFHRHARAAATSNLVDLAAVAEAFQARTMPVLAAEVKARMARITSDEARARWLTAEARELMRSAGLTTSPFLELAEPADTTRLTSRQLEVARMAARRFRSKEIAAALDLSTRTVDNVLGQVYRALGVSSRDELSAALGRSGDE